MARPPKLLREGEWASYWAPARSIAERVRIVRLYQTRTGPRALVLTRSGKEISVRPSQLRRR
jgi:hypothetical protein